MPSLVDLATLYLKTRYTKPGNVYVGLLHRLDRPTSGVVLLAKTSKAAGRLSAQFRAGTISKLYWAIVEGTPLSRKGNGSTCSKKTAGRNRSGVVVAAEFVEQGSPGRVPRPGAIGQLDQARAAARDRSKPPASRSAREAGSTDRR